MDDNTEIAEKVEEDLDDAVPPVAGVNAEQEKLIAEGYDPATAGLPDRLAGVVTILQQRQWRSCRTTRSR